MFKRPASLPAGQLWLRFEGRGRDGATGQMFQIRDLEPQHQEECIELMMESFLNDEPLCKVFDVRSDPVSCAVVRRDWQHMMSQGVSVACFTEDRGQPHQLVGCNILLVKERGQQEEIYGAEGKAWLNLLATLMAAESLVDVFAHFGVHGYLTSSGLSVRPQYRGQNIGARLIEARKPLCKALGLSASATVFTATASQVLAGKCGYEVLATLSYADMPAYGVNLDPHHPALKENQVAEVRGIKFAF